jgi:hypothetical protein
MRRTFRKPIAWRAAAAVAAVVLGGAPLVAQAPELAMLDRLTKGAWNLRFRDNGSQRKICLQTGRELIQLRHRQSGCSRFVVRDTPDEVVVQYTCRGNGYGRTSIRRESNGLVQIQSQGIEGGTPFALNVEARHTGSC